uniref:Uncharacterized protein n=1 Tax=Cannabis sativa TaxID=3483 RepID=A0A803RB36_CANSA
MELRFNQLWLSGLDSVLCPMCSLVETTSVDVMVSFAFQKFIYEKYLSIYIYLYTHAYFGLFLNLILLYFIVLL